MSTHANRVGLADALACLVRSTRELRKWRRLERALAACYPGEQMKVVRADRLAELKAKAGEEDLADILARMNKANRSNA